MVSVASLLNPISTTEESHYQLPSPPLTSYRTDYCSSRHPPQKKQKMTKDAAIFARGNIQGEIRYAPCERQDEVAAVEHTRFKVYPMGHISEFRRHIPYNSEKKSFWEKTGRGAFEVFQYTFKIPTDDREYTVMWDYNIGLVRITPFFKCCRYQKTIPAKMLNSNPGLREICHSITGGALVAQGYWMPFEAAKAVVATFCYDIRYALTPVFGLDFVNLCVEPDNEAFGRMIIDPEIVRRCTEEAKDYRTLSRNSSSGSSPVVLNASSSSSRWASKDLRPRPTRQFKPAGKDFKRKDINDQYFATPQSISVWSPINTPRSNQQSKNSSPRTLLADNSFGCGYSVPPTSPISSSGGDSAVVKKPRQSFYENHDKRMSPCFATTHTMPRKRRISAILTSTRDARAAYALMQLHFADASLKDGSLKRRASS